VSTHGDDGHAPSAPLGALAETLQSAAVLAWVGGHAALGAFAARIVFRDLPRALAAPTMTTIFRSFDRLIVGALLVLALATAMRTAALGFGRGAHIVAFGAALGLLVLGAFELAYVHPQIEAMFRAGRTLEPAFARLHRISERCGHLEVVLAMLLFAGQAFARGASRRSAS
jgi:hypothetical protein